jgi:hypothetical protein
MKPNTLDDEQRISIDTEPLNDATFRVSDTVVEDIGITQVVGVTLLSGCERYAIEWATHSDTAVVSHLDGDSEWEVNIEDIQTVEE